MEENSVQTRSDISKWDPAPQHSSKITVYTLLCFGLAGLIAGFAIGGFAGHIIR